MRYMLHSQPFVTCRMYHKPTVVVTLDGSLGRSLSPISCHSLLSWWLMLLYGFCKVFLFRAVISLSSIFSFGLTEGNQSSDYQENHRLMFLWSYTYIHTHTRLMFLFPGLPGWAGTRKVKPIWILLKQETVSGSGISWAICKSAPCSRQITTPAPHHSVFYRPDALPTGKPTASKHWRYITARVLAHNNWAHG